jgi:hypothetical protein
MKTMTLNRLLITALLIISSAFSSAFATGNSQEENTDQDTSSELYLNTSNINDMLCQNADPNQIFIIIDHYDRIITQGRCSDVMVRFFLKISDPLLEVDNIKYFRLGYENPEIMEQRLALEK